MMDPKTNEPVMAVKPMTMAERVQSLPPELFNKIYEEVFTPPNSEIVKTTLSYRPSHLLAVDSASREKYAQAYYPKTTFDLTLVAWMNTWLSALNKGHRKLVRAVQLIRGDDSHYAFQNQISAGWRIYHETSDTSAVLGVRHRPAEKDEAMDFEVLCDRFGGKEEWKSRIVSRSKIN
jgi:hypothetical protein